MIAPKNQSATSRQSPTCVLKTVSHTAHAGIIRRRRAIGTDGVSGKFARWIGIAFVLLALLQGTALAGALNHEEQGLVRHLVGDAGQNRNRGEMQLDPVLTAVAQARALDLATRRYFSHVNPDGIGPNSLVRAAGYVLPAFWGGDRSGNFIESIGAGYNSPEDAWAGWMKSSGHRSHLLAGKSFYRNQTRYGVGYHFDRASPFRNYWVVITAPPSQSQMTGASVQRAPQDESRSRFRMEPVGKLQVMERKRPAGLHDPVVNRRGRSDAGKTIAASGRTDFRFPGFLDAIFAP